MITRTAVIGASVGLHARPAALFAQAVDDKGIDVTLTFDGEEADAASALEIMTLGVKGGDTVTLTTDEEGAEAEAAMDDLAAMLTRDLDAE
ncbi:HPr family phosphocarrier protein [Bifidobacterium avesanii]|uniref:Phosphocarrier protein HPr n=1 Tax=Bifidobacterium avesanii TaxID=1798157 RepID=A0A7K3TGB3_9BIFI|nr:HPr family phosphocarrier protein [Bifidobacterium avesanii]KAB8294620.1 phosphotransferase [Bifidobacterium avesanii]NEG78128.1 HPr family phosphocarrier protein [Bifidobacterium avesanii]